MYGSDEITAGGGKALPFYASCRIRVSTTKGFTDKNGQACGIMLNLRNKKSRSFKPFLKVEGVQLFYEKGINPIGGLLTVLKEAGRIVAHGKAGNYKVEEPWAGGKEVTFRASAKNNIVPVEILLECPALVDAKDKEELTNYLSIFADAINLVNSGELGETAVEADEEDISKIIGSGSSEKEESDE